MDGVCAGNGHGDGIADADANVASDGNQVLYPAGRPSPMMSRLRSWTERLNPLQSDKRSMKNDRSIAPREKTSASECNNATGTCEVELKSPYLNTRKMTHSLTRLFGRSFSFSRAKNTTSGGSAGVTSGAGSCGGGGEERPQSASPPPQRASDMGAMPSVDFVRKLSTSLDCMKNSN